MVPSRSHPEGVIRYQLRFRRSTPPTWEGYPTLNAWRRILFRLRLIGQDAGRYGGLGFGNVSERVAGGFVISATQTGGFETLRPEHYCLVQQADPDANLIVASGVEPPSSEALTHAAVYQASSRVRVVLHGHCPEIWRQRDRLARAHTPATVEYGTPAMAKAVARWVKEQPNSDIIVMEGHPDGILAYGRSADEAGKLVVETLARAWSVACQGGSGSLSD